MQAIASVRAALVLVLALAAAAPAAHAKSAAEIDSQSTEALRHLIASNPAAKSLA